jgi:soluble lytic murein transglycosylase-like protein
MVVGVVAVAAVCEARLAVFADGRVLKVDDAYLQGNHLVLELPGGGWIRVPAVSIDRVIADEVTGNNGTEITDPPQCDFGWADESLPLETPYAAAIEHAARAAGIHPWLLAAVVQVESAFDPRAVSRAGAAGLAQLMPAAAADHHVRDVFDPGENLRGGAEHLSALLDRFQSLPLALAAYNAGAATVERSGGVPPYRETRQYVRRVLAVFCPQHRSPSPSP